MYTLTLLAKVEHLPQWMQFIADCAQEHGLPSKRLREIELALEEVLVNICQYAYPKHVGEVEVACRLDAQRHFIIDIIDQGIPFDPLSLEDPDLPEDLDRRQVGGLGLFLVRKLMDEVSYHREDNQNIMTLTVDLNANR